MSYVRQHNQSNAAYACQGAQQWRHLTFAPLSTAVSSNVFTKGHQGESHLSKSDQRPPFLPLTCTPLSREQQKVHFAGIAAPSPPNIYIPGISLTCTCSRGSSKRCATLALQPPTQKRKEKKTHDNTAEKEKPYAPNMLFPSRIPMLTSKSAGMSGNTLLMAWKW